MNALILQLMAIQVVIPLVLVMLNTVLPAASLLALILRAGAILMVIAYSALAGLWLFPPCWTPYALAVAHLAGTTFAWSRIGRRKEAAPLWRRRAETGLAALAIAGLGVLLVPVFQGRTAPADAVDLAMPLGPGTYYVTSGGGTEAINAHLGTLEAERFRAYRGQSYAVDLIGIDGMGLRAAGIAPANPAAYVIYGTAVLAPCAGEVLAVRDDLPDMTVPEADRDNLAGNHVLLGCGGYVVLLAHLAPGTAGVASGQRVESGAVIGQVGNSGNTAEPHLHIHVQRGMPDGAPLAGEPKWFTIGGRFLVRNDIVRVP
jgi:hypothetical protein